MSDLFVLALKNYVDHIRDVMNDEAVYQLWRLNKMDMRYMPRLEFSGLEKDNISEWLNALSQVANANLITPSKEIQEEILDRLDLPTEEAGKQWDKVEEIRDDLIAVATQAQESSTAVAGAGNGSSSKTNGSVSPKAKSQVSSIVSPKKIKDN